MNDSIYIPNNLPRFERILNFLWAMGLFTYASYGYVKGSLYLPGLNGNEGITFDNKSLTMIVIAMILGGINLMLTIVDHFDKRNNEKVYKILSRIFMAIGVSLIVCAHIYRVN